MYKLACIALITITTLFFIALATFAYLSCFTNGLVSVNFESAAYVTAFILIPLFFFTGAFIGGLLGGD